LESLVRSDSSPQPCENSLDQRDITAINKSSGWAAAAEPTIPTERLAVSSGTGVGKLLFISYTFFVALLRRISDGRQTAPFLHRCSWKRRWTASEQQIPRLLASLVARDDKHY